MCSSTPATSYSPRWFCLPESRTASGRQNPNQVHSLTSLETTWERNVADEMKKNPPIRGRFFFHGIRQRPTLPGDFACLNPAQRAADKILTKYNAAHWLGQSEKIKLSGCMKRKDPPFRAGLFFSWNPATSYSPRSSPTKYHRR